MNEKGKSVLNVWVSPAPPSHPHVGDTRVFDAAGVELTASAYGNRYTFQGREIDWTTGLIHFRARWYDPEQEDGSAKTRSGFVAV